MTITHPVTGQQITPSGTVGNVYPISPDSYSIKIHEANCFVDISHNGKFIVAVGGNMEGRIYDTESEAEAEADSWRESYPDTNVEVIEVAESWGTAAYGNRR